MAAEDHTAGADAHLSQAERIFAENGALPLAIEESLIAKPARFSLMMATASANGSDTGFAGGPSAPGPWTPWRAVRGTLAAACVVASFALLFRFRHVVLLLFLAIVLATVLEAERRPSPPLGTSLVGGRGHGILPVRDDRHRAVCAAGAAIGRTGATTCRVAATVLRDLPRLDPGLSQCTAPTDRRSVARTLAKCVGIAPARARDCEGEQARRVADDAGDARRSVELRRVFAEQRVADARTADAAILVSRARSGAQRCAQVNTTS